MKVAIILGTRPEAVKLAPLIRAFKNRTGLQTEVCVTGQHREMLDQVLQVFNIAPDVDFNLMQPGQSLAGLTARALAACDAYLIEAEPDVVLVQGDTSTVMAAALASFYRHIPVGHIEAGLRTWNMRAPFPEEMNRVVTARIADMHFAPTEQARENLLQEGISPGSVFVTGNTVIDALLFAAQIVRRDPPKIPGLPSEIQPGTSGPRVVLITGHRRENFGVGFEGILTAIADLAVAHPQVHFVYPVHLNPRVREQVQGVLGSGRHGDLPNIHLIDPLDYLPFIAVMERSYLLLTDSGGVQEEAPSLGKPVLVMRDTTERPEAVAMGAVRLVGANREKIVKEVGALLENRRLYDSMARVVNPYGDGFASERILEHVVNRFSNSAKGMARAYPAAT